MHPEYPEFPLHKKKDPSGMIKPVRELFAKAQKEDLAPSVQKLFAEAKSKQAKKVEENQEKWENLENLENQEKWENLENQENIKHMVV